MSISLRISVKSGPPNYPKNQGDNGNDQKNMNHPSRTIYKEPQDPSDNQNDSNEIQ